MQNCIFKGYHGCSLIVTASVIWSKIACQTLKLFCFILKYNFSIQCSCICVTQIFSLSIWRKDMLLLQTSKSYKTENSRMYLMAIKLIIELVWKFCNFLLLRLVKIWFDNHDIKGGIFHYSTNTTLFISCYKWKDKQFMNQPKCRQLLSYFISKNARKQFIMLTSSCCASYGWRRI